jgi:hypothetical protein
MLAELTSNDLYSFLRRHRHMTRLLQYSAFILAILAADRWAHAAVQDKPATPAEQYQALVKEFSAASRVIWEDNTDQGKQAAAARVDKLPLKLIELAESNPKDPIAMDALIQVVTMEYWLNTYTSHPGWGKDSPQARSMAIMLRDHLESDKLGQASWRVCYCFRQECEPFLRTVLEKSPHREVRGQACLRLAQFLSNRREKFELLKDQPELTGRYELLYGKDYVETLLRQDRATIFKEVESLYEQAIEKYADVTLPYDVKVAETAKTELFEIRHFAVGKQAEEIEGVDQDGRQFKLSDYRDKVVLLYFWSEF